MGECLIGNNIFLVYLPQTDCMHRSLQPARTDAYKT